MATVTVHPGDTLSRIAVQHRTSVAELARLNGLSSPDRITVGQSIALPSTEAPRGWAPPTRSAAVARHAPVEAAAPTAQAGKDLTVGQLRRVMPGLSAARAEQMLPHLNVAMREANINTPKRQAAFLAQLGHESGSLRYMEEIDNGSRYEGRRDLGNTHRGDGRRFKGRGPMMLTGRANYTQASRDLGIDLVSNPGRAATPEVGFKVAAWFWNTRKLNPLADQGRFDAITKRINGGDNNKPDRDRRYALAKRELGV